MITARPSSRLTAKTLKTISALFVMVGLLATVGCRTPADVLPPYHGKLGIATPSITLRQGGVGQVIVTLQRSPGFDRDVAVITTPPDGIETTPHYVAVRATDQPILGVQVNLPQDTALGEYRVNVTGTPKQSDPVATYFIVTVIAP